MHHGLSIYKSSAGSGKTYTLVRAYLTLVLARPHMIRHTLAITFTNKAAAEMKSRIIDALVSISENKPSSLATELQTLLPDVDLPSQAALALSFIIHEYPSFHIATIDSFFHQVVRAFAREMHLPVNFEIELDSDTVSDFVIDALFQELESNPQLAHWLTQFAISNIENDRSWHIDHSLAAFARQLIDGNKIDITKLPDKENLKLLIIELRKTKRYYENTMRALGQQAIDLIEDHDFTVESFAYGKSGPANYFYNIISPKDSDKYIPKTRVLNTFENPDSWATASKDKNGLVRDFGKHHLAPMLEQCLAFHNEHFTNYITAAATLRNIYVAGVVSDLNSKLKKFRDENDVLLISDVPSLLQHILTDSDAPFVYEKTGNLFHHYLLDEFQDTSAQQWNNLQPLVSNTLASGNNTLVVGDTKQSIYRWRGGDYALLQSELEAHFKNVVESIYTENLGVNYRSGIHIINFNNSFFESAAVAIGAMVNEAVGAFLKAAYSKDNLHQQAPENNTKAAGYVAFRKVETESETTDDDESVTWQETALREMATKIKLHEDAGGTLGDIAILVRTNSEGSKVARFLFDNGYTKIVSADSLLIIKSDKVRFLLSALKCMINKEDPLSLAYIAAYISAIKSEEQFDFLPHENQRKDLKKALEFIHALRYKPFATIIESLITHFALCITPDAYVQRFQDLLLEYTLKHNTSLTGFLQWWDEIAEKDSSSIIVPAQSDAITIMTIHKAKGLQFPVVMIPIGKWQLGPKPNSTIWAATPYAQAPLLPVSLSKKMLEQSFYSEQCEQEIALNYADTLNLMYVAFTRAESKLYVWYPGEKQTGVLNNTGKLIDNVLNELDSEYLQTSLFAQGEEAFGMESKTKESSVIQHNLKVQFSNPEIGRPMVARGFEKYSNLLDDTSGTTPRQFGNLVHSLLEQIHSPDDVAAVVQTLKSDALLTPKEIQQFETQLHFIVNDSGIKHFFHTQSIVLTEQEILLPGGTTSRPDRMLLNGKEIRLLDYKTGEQRDTHARQVNEYATLLTAGGYTVVEKALYYTSQDKYVIVN